MSSIVRANMNEAQYKELCLTRWWDKLDADRKVDLWEKFGDTTSAPNPGVNEAFRQFLLRDGVPRDFPACVPLWFFTMQETTSISTPAGIGAGFMIGLTDLHNAKSFNIENENTVCTGSRAEFLTWLFVGPQDEAVDAAAEATMCQILKDLNLPTAWLSVHGHPSVWECLDCGCMILVDASQYDTTPPGLQNEFATLDDYRQWVADLILEAASHDLESIKMDMLLEYYRMQAVRQEKSTTL